VNVTSRAAHDASEGLGARENIVRPGRTLAIVCIGFAMVIVDTTIVNVALPAVRDSLGSDLSTLQWVVDGYVLVLASLLLSGGALVDRFGSARVLRLAVALFTLASVACGLAPNSAVLVGARLVQGVAAAMLMPAAMALISKAYPDPVAKAKAVALFTTAAGSPQAFGPVLGGVLVTTIGWRSIFFINVPIGSLALALAARGGLPSAEPDRETRSDVVGQALVVVGLAGLTGALIEGGSLGWSSPAVVVAAAVALVAAAAFVVRERRAAAPMLPAALVGAPRLVPFVAIGLLLFTAYYGLLFALNLFLQQVHQVDALQTGLQFLPSALPVFLLPVFAGRLSVRFGAHRVTLCGLAVAAVGAVALLVVSTTNGALPLTVALFVLGCGVGLTVGPQIALVVGAAPDGTAGTASGLLNAGRQTGSVLGVAVLGAIAGVGVTAQDRVSGLHIAALVAGALLVVAVGLAARRPANERTAARS
jgi:DHA2 family methylenomycin A resistance protein-like MFS transporter